MDSLSAQAGPSVPKSQSNQPTLSNPKKRKPKGPHPSSQPPNQKRTKLLPPLPPRPTTFTHSAPNSHSLPIRPLQGIPTKRTDSTKPGFGRETIFVTRRTPLGGLIGRCKGMILDEGYLSIKIYAVGAAIPQAMLLLFALLDVLPFPRGKKGMWYEIRTGGVECVDEVEDGVVGPGLGQGDGGDVEDEFRGIGGVEEDEPRKEIRIKSTIEIDLHLRPRPKDGAPKGLPPQPKSGTKKSRPSKKKRMELAAKARVERGDGDEEEMDEEAAMNNDVAGSRAVPIEVEDEVEEEEEIEER